MAMREDRLFVKDGRKHYRRRYSVREAQLGLLVLVGLAAIAAWVADRGAHPDPELFTASASLEKRDHAAPDRGPLPASLAPEGWSESAIGLFARDDLYVKINGRAGYYEGYGVRRLYFVSYSKGEATIDVELYELSTGENAIGAYSGERAAEHRSVAKAGGLTHVARNAVMLAKGLHYARIIGSDEGEETMAAAGAIAGALLAGLPETELPWAHRLFGQTLGLDVGQMSYSAEDAFSFSFGKDVYAAPWGEGDTEVFVSPSAEAEALAKRYADGFGSLGDAQVVRDGVRWAQDPYLGGYSGAKAAGGYVLGVRNAAGLELAVTAMNRLEAAVRSLEQPAPEEK